ncbi:MAG: VOC family protein [Pseudomonadota bacterium]
MATPFGDMAIVLEVSDIDRSVAFYRDVLGFNVGGRYGEPVSFAILRRGGCIVFLDKSETPRPIPVNQYWAAYFYVADADAAAGEMREQDAEIIRGPEDMPYGCRDFDVRDPDGHILAFGQDLEEPMSV